VFSPRTGALLTVVLTLAAGCSSGVRTPAAAARSSPAPATGKSIVALGHSGATGYNSDPNDGSRDARENSWATGTNPAVDSIYLRLLGKDSQYKDHNYNLAQDGATVDDLVEQAAKVQTVRPIPHVVLVQIVDNDIKCDGTDSQNYAPFARKLTEALHAVTNAAPATHIYLVSVWGSVQSYTDAAKAVPAARDSYTGDGPCDLFDDSGAVRHQGVVYQQDVIDHYHEQLKNVCGTIPACTYDGGALQTYVLAAGDLTPDGNHLTVQGHKKYADLVWKTFFAG
jgi:GDSL-like Lipase/Acylhydrolase